MKEGYYKEIFRIKIAEEYRLFKNCILLLSSEEVFANAYRIDIMINIYEVLIEMADDLGEEEIKELLGYHKLLEFLYERWLKTEDDFYQQIKDCMKQTIEMKTREQNVVERSG